MSRDDVSFVDITTMYEGLVSHEVLSRRVLFLYMLLMMHLLIILIFLNTAKKKFWKYVQYKL